MQQLWHACLWLQNCTAEFKINGSDDIRYGDIGARGEVSFRSVKCMIWQSDTKQLIKLVGKVAKAVQTRVVGIIKYSPAAFKYFYFERSTRK